MGDTIQTDMTTTTIKMDAKFEMGQVVSFNDGKLTNNTTFEILERGYMFGEWMYKLSADENFEKIFKESELMSMGEIANLRETIINDIENAYCLSTFKSMSALSRVLNNLIKLYIHNNIDGKLKDKLDLCITNLQLIKSSNIISSNR